MADDLIPAGHSGTFLEKLNLPKLVAGPAGEAISRLVAGAVDIPAAFMNQFAQTIRDKTEAKTAVSKAVGEAAANLAANDPQIVQRAAYALLSKQIRQQANRESIAKKTIEILSEEGNEQTEQQSAHKVDDDWLNVFERYAEDASSERLQLLWARILSGQLRRPKAFSLQTLRFVSELDEHTAALFEKYAPRVVSANFLPYPATTGIEFGEFLQLQEFGLITGVGGLLQKIFELNVGPMLFSYNSRVLMLHLTKKLTLQFPAILLTRIGKEIYSILKITDDVEHAKKFVDQIPKDNIAVALYIPKTPTVDEALEPIVLWQMPSSPTGEQQPQAPPTQQA